jgi:hypothetical protein
MSRKSKKRQHRKNLRKAGRDTVKTIDENEIEIVSPVSDESPSPVGRASPGHPKKYSWIEIIVGGGVLAALLTLAGTFAIQELHDWWYRPRLEVKYAHMVLGAAGIRNGAEIKNYGILFDDVEKCNIAGYSIKGTVADTQMWDSTVESIWKISVYNAGRSPITNANFTLDHATDFDWIGAESTPNLSVDVTTAKASGLVTHAAIIRTIPPGIGGVITLKTKLLGVNLSVSQVVSRGNTDTFQYVWQGFPANNSLLYLGSNELGYRQTLVASSAKQILQEESQLFGRNKISLPYIEDPGISGAPGESSTWQLVTWSPYPYCPTPPGVTSNFEYTSSVQRQSKLKK